MVEQPWTAGRLLDTWGLRVCGSSFRDPVVRSQGDLAGSDDELQAVYYVESTAGFDLARPVLRWKHVEFRRLVDFPLRHPGETLLRALLRYGWAGCIADRPIETPIKVYNAFFDALSERCRTSPFVPYRELAEPDAQEIAAAASQDLHDTLVREGAVPPSCVPMRKKPSQGKRSA